MAGHGVDNFRPLFKYYKSRQPRPDLSTVLAARPDQEGVVQLSSFPLSTAVCPRCCQCVGLRPPKQWSVFALENNPGLLMIRNPFTPAGQRLWIAKCLMEYPDPPNVNNITNIVQKTQQRNSSHDGRSPCLPADLKPIDASGGEIYLRNDTSSPGGERGSPNMRLSGNNLTCVLSKGVCSSGDMLFPSNDACKSELSRVASQETNRIESTPRSLALKDDKQALDGPSGDGESPVVSWWLEVLESGGVKTETCQKLRWATLGYHHDWDTKHYSPEKHTPIPPCMANLTATLARGLTMFLPSEPQEEHQANGDQPGCRSGSEAGPSISHSSPTDLLDRSPTAPAMVHDASPQGNGSLDSTKVNSSSEAPSISSVTGNGISFSATLDDRSTAHSSDLASNSPSLRSVNGNTPTSASPNITRTQLLQFRAEAAIVNYYHPGTTLSPHTDVSEPNREAPLFSISFGQPCVFLVGGPSRDLRPTALCLDSGDVVVMGGAARLAYHAVPLVTSRDQWRALDGVLDGQQEPWTGGGDGEGSSGQVKEGENVGNITGIAVEGNPIAERLENCLKDQESCDSKLPGCEREQVCGIKGADCQKTPTEHVKKISCSKKVVDEKDAGVLPMGKRPNESSKHFLPPSSDDSGNKRSRREQVFDACNSLYRVNNFGGHHVKNDCSEHELFNEYKHFSENERIAMLEYISTNRINMNIRQVCTPGEVGLGRSNYC